MSLKAMIWAWEQTALSATAKLILLKLADNTNDETGDCYPKISTVAKHCQCHRRTVERSIKTLQEMGFLTVIHQSRDGRRINSIYRLNIQNNSQNKPQKTEKLDTAQSRIDTAQSQIRYGTESQQEPVNITTKSIKIMSEKKISDDDMKLSKFIFSKIQDINPKEKPPNFNQWANTIRLIRERDNRTHKEIQDVFLWANNDPFWKINIRSPDKLRKQFTVLEDNKKNEGNYETHRKNNQQAKNNSLERETARNIERINQLDRDIAETEKRISLR